jgi:S-adenosylmethionine hydrolase
MIVLFTDFGPGPYTGQMRAVLARDAPGIEVIELMSDAPSFAPRASAYLLAALAPEFPRDTVFLAVIDPGVGGARPPVIAKAGGQVFVGPGNGLFEIVLRRAQSTKLSEIAWRPERLSSSFHGRDLFAPVAARLALGTSVACKDTMPPRQLDWPDDLAEMIYIDRYGNAMTGLRASILPRGAMLNGLARADTFSSVGAGKAFWYENANGLAEIAINQGSAAASLGLSVGDTIAIS